MGRAFTVAGEASPVLTGTIANFYGVFPSVPSIVLSVSSYEISLVILKSHRVSILAVPLRKPSNGYGKQLTMSQIARKWQSRVLLWVTGITCATCPVASQDEKCHSTEDWLIFPKSLGQDVKVEWVPVS